MYEKNLHTGMLLDFYGEILPENQKKIVDFYYNDDLSLAEISDEIGITRQGVRDALKRAEETLYRMEDKLGLAERFRKAQQQMQDLTEELTQLKANLDSQNENMVNELIQKLQQIEL